MSKRVLFVCARFFPDKGGVEKHVFELSKELIQKGFIVDVLTVSSDAEIPPTTTIGDINVFRIKAFSRGFLNRLYVNFRFILNISRFRGSDIIHFHDYFPVWGWNLINVFFIKILFNKKFYVTFHGWEGNYPPKNSIIFKRRLVDKLSAGSISIGHYVNKWYKTCSRHVSYGAVSSPEVKCLRKPVIPEENSKKIQFLFIGRLESDTGILQYLNQLEELFNHRDDYELTICGDGSLFLFISEMIQSFSYKIYMKGFIDDIDSSIKSADFVLTSGYLGILEALSHGKPVIAVYDNKLKRDYLTMMPRQKDMFLICDDSVKIVDILNIDDKVLTNMVNLGSKFALSQSWSEMRKKYEKLWNIN
jgi:glycosyltransferase involved in cell wall biosynthesis